MNLEDVTIRIRPRSKWEGADLGVLMVKAWWKPMLGAWLVITLPVYVTLLLVFSNLSIGMIVFWWLKPIFERSHLFVISQALFGNTPTVKQTIRSFWSAATIQWFMSLSFRRFSLTRSADLPIIQLEGLSGKERKKRIQVLHRHNINPASWLTVLGVHIESAILMGVFGLIIAFIPQQTEFDYMVYISDTESSYQLLTAVIGYIALSMVAPYYVAAGFGIYINTRTHLEGWDIELAFRRIANRFSTSKTRAMASTASMFIMAILIGSLSSIGSVEAQTDYRLPPKSSHTPTSAKKLIDDVLNTDDFHHITSVRKLKLKDGTGFNFLDWLESLFKGEKQIDSDSLSWVHSVGRVLAFIFEVLLWAIPVIVIFYLLLYFKDKNIYFKRHKKSDARPLPISMFGLDMREEKLPDDILEEAARLWQSKDHRQALSLLYRASLVRLMHGYKVRFEQGDTEGECLHKVQSKVAEDLAVYFKRMTGAWINLAYGHRRPTNDAFDQLCQTWAQSFNDTALSVND